MLQPTHKLHHCCTIVVAYTLVVPFFQYCSQIYLSNGVFKCSRITAVCATGISTASSKHGRRFESLRAASCRPLECEPLLTISLSLNISPRFYLDKKNSRTQTHSFSGVFASQSSRTTYVPPSNESQKLHLFRGQSLSLVLFPPRLINENTSHLRKSWRLDIYSGNEFNTYFVSCISRMARQFFIRTFLFLLFIGRVSTWKVS